MKLLSSTTTSILFATQFSNTLDDPRITNPAAAQEPVRLRALQFLNILPDAPLSATNPLFKSL